MKGIQGPCPHQRGGNHKNAFTGLAHLKILFSRTNNPEKTHIYMKASQHSVKSNLLRLWYPGVKGGHNKGNYFKLFEKSLFA
jgi:hypothetical protein